MFESFKFNYIYIFSAHVMSLSKITGQMATTKKNHKRKKLLSAKLYQELESGTTELEKRD